MQAMAVILVVGFVSGWDIVKFVEALLLLLAVALVSDSFAKLAPPRNSTIHP